MNPEFTDAQESFCKSNCGEFEDTDENKLVYTEVFDRHGRPSSVVRRPLVFKSFAHAFDRVRTVKRRSTEAYVCVINTITR